MVTQRNSLLYYAVVLMTLTVLNAFAFFLSCGNETDVVTILYLAFYCETIIWKPLPD